MSLKFVVDSVDGLSADVAGLYTKNNDGKYYLEVDGAVSKTKLDEFRENNVKLLKDLEKYKDIDPAKYGDLLKLQAKADEKKLIDAGEIDKVVEQRVNQMRDTMSTEITTLKQANDVAKRQLESLLIDSSVRDAAIKSGVQPLAVDDVLLRAKTTFQVKDGAAVPVDSKGGIIFGKDGSTPMSVADWTASLKKSAPHLFQGSSGGGASGSSGGKLGDTSKLSAVQKISAGLEGI
jgi:hypothetical protein